MELIQFGVAIDCALESYERPRMYMAVGMSHDLHNILRSREHVLPRIDFHYLRVLMGVGLPIARGGTV